MSANLHFKTLPEYLNSVKITDKEEKNITHTVMGDVSLNVYPGKYKIKEEHKDYFYNLYTKWIFNWEEEHHVTEKHHPEYSPVLIDLDFRYPIDKGSERIYPIDCLIMFLQRYLDIISTYLEIEDEQKVCYIMEKSSPVKDNKKNIMKDGVHIMLPYIVSKYQPLFLTRLELLKEQDIIELFKNIGFTNPIEDIVDEAVIERNNWFMYGSSKPGKERYKITSILKYDSKENKLINTGTETGLSNLELVKLFSVYNFNEKYICEVKEEENVKLKLEELEKIEEKKKNVLKKKNMVKSKGKGFKNNTNENLDVIRKLASILSSKRADKHDDWMRVGWCLHNIDYRLLDSWVEFSAQSDKVNIEGIQHGRSKERCEYLWEGMENRGLELGSLHRWAKGDNIKQYTDIMREDLSNLIRGSLNMTHYDISKVVYKMLKHEFKCVNIRNKEWFMFKNHRWNSIDCAVELRKKISEEVVNEYCKFASDCNIKVQETTDEDQRETWIKRGQTANKISLKLREETFKNNVLNSCSVLFHDSKFYEKLDSNVNLVGFLNGVYDLEKREFREGLPEDYISFCTGIDYEEYDNDDSTVKQVKTFLSQVLPIKRVRDYVLKILGSILSGKTGDEKFHVWTGCHAKDSPILMFNGLKKKVQDIVQGEFLMGPDGTSREVKKLVRGRDLMYRITPRYGKSFVVNGGHILYLRNYWTGKYIEISVKDYISKYNFSKEYVLVRSEIEYNGSECSNDIKYPTILDRSNELQNSLHLNGEKVNENTFKIIVNNKKKIDRIKDMSNSLGYHYNYINNELFVYVSNEMGDVGILNTFEVSLENKENYYGFTLDKDHLYLDGEYIVHHNCGGNGKSKIIELFELAFGDYCGKMSVTLLTQKRAASNACTPELVKNKGRRFITLQEPDDDESIHVGAMKELTGGDKMQARALHQAPIEFKPQWTIIMTSNVLPHVSSNDRGTWRRIRVTEFISKFVDEDEIEPGVENQFPIDYDLSTKMKMWPEAFMWMIIQEYHNYTKYGLKEPPEVVKNTEAYKQESDSFLQFIHECLEESIVDKIKVDDGYHVYREWFKNSGNNAKPPQKKDFIKNVSKKYGNPNARGYWKGITFINKNTDEGDGEED